MVFKRIGSPLDQDEQNVEVDRYAKLSLSLGGCRAWSKLGQRIPPFSCAGAACADRVVGQSVVNRMKEEWEAWQWLEKESYRNPVAEEILKELVWPRKQAIRLFYLLFERVPPDNRLIEDVHAHL